MRALGTGTSTRAAAALRQDAQATSARSATPREAEDGAAPLGAPEPEETTSGAGHGRGAGRRASEKPEATTLRGLLNGLRAGDLESVLLTVAMAADENRMPSVDPEEVGRILAFLDRLAAEHDATLPPPPAPPRPEGSGAGPEGPVDGGADDWALDPR
jgi:hypothetical protein